MNVNGKRLVVATLVELAVRTTGKVAIKSTRRGFGDSTEAMYVQAQMNVKNELSLRGMLDV